MSTHVVIKGYTSGSGRRAGHWPASVTRTTNYMQADAQHVASVQATYHALLLAVGQARSRDRALVC